MARSLGSKRSHGAWWTLSIVAASTMAACSSATDARRETTNRVAQATGNMEGMFEYAIDAPWRMDPRTVNGSLVYDRLPIQMSIHDADQIQDDVQGAGAFPVIGDVCELVITEGSTVTYFPTDIMAEIERARGDWTYPGTKQPHGPPRDYCTRTSTATCSAYASVNGTSEWHALAMYALHETRPGADVPLTFELRVARSPLDSCSTPGIKVYRLVNHARVHLGEAQLPRFGTGWAYGDVHYHSQGTDNEGESAYNYRGVSRAMQAVGLDFTWASEHASASEQIMDVDISEDALEVDVMAMGSVLRDMDERRFTQMATSVSLANLSSALRGTASTKTGIPVVPQIFLGGEVDVVPESTMNASAGIPWGAGEIYSMSSLCGGWTPKVGEPDDSCPAVDFRCYGLDPWSACDSSRLSWPAQFGSSPTQTDGYVLGDVQGINEYRPGREHIVYLPDPAQADPFVASHTDVFGGATRRLTKPLYHGTTASPPLLPEIEQKNGSVFLAHHLNAPSLGSQGPEGPPWTPSMLDQAWRSSAVIGLEFWNENKRRISHLDNDPSTPNVAYETGYERDSTIEVLGSTVDVKLVDQARRGIQRGSNGLFDLVPFDLATGRYDEALHDVEHQITDGTASLDQMNLRGLYPSQTATLAAWLAAGQPRRMFLAGGSDAHGDFNYRRKGYMTGTSEITDARIGSPRNLVYAGAPTTVLDPSAPRVYGAAQILAALRAGHFTATDGMAMRIVVDTNHNGVVDATDPMMGDSVHLPNQSTIPILVEWLSTTEMGPLAAIELTVGVLDDTTETARLYAGGEGVVGGEGAPTRTYGKNGWLYQLTTRGYWLAAPLQTGPTPTNVEEIQMLSDFLPRAPAPQLYHGVRAFNLDLDRLEVDSGNRPNRLFVRALGIGRPPVEFDCANTSDAAREGLCTRRYALTNPIWIDTKPWVPRQLGGTLGAVLVNAP